MERLHPRIRINALSRPRETGNEQKLSQPDRMENLVLVAVLSAAWQIQAQDAKQPYPRMAPIEQYQMDRNAEIAMARSAAPGAVHIEGCQVLVMGQKIGAAVEGKNGFVCLVGRSWLAPFKYRSFGIPGIGALSASTRQPCRPSCLMS